MTSSALLATVLSACLQQAVVQPSAISGGEREIARISTTESVQATPKTIRIKNLKTLVAIYRGRPGEKGRMDEHALDQCRNGCELARLFYFRNCLARLNCELHYLLIDEAAPDNKGPTMRNIEADLRNRGVAAGQYDGVIATGVGLSGNWGGFSLSFQPATKPSESVAAKSENADTENEGEAPGVPGGIFPTAGCFGGHDIRGKLTWYPQDDPDVAYGTAWNFAHEYQHAIDLVIAENSRHKEFLHAHPYTDRNEPFFMGCYNGGEHWDWIACTFREFDGWSELQGATNGFIDAVDADGDGLPDDDPRLPMDEKRFGSDPTKRDTDGDGLDDLHEFTADRYAGSDPIKADTDGDGIDDGHDPYPLVAIRPTLGYAADGGKPVTSDLLLNSVFARNDPGGQVEVHGSWHEDRLALTFSGPRKFVVHAKIDGSASNGFWEGGDTYLLRLAENDVRFDGLGLSGPVPNAMATGGLVADSTVGTESGSGDQRKPSSPGDRSRWFLDVVIPAKLGQGISKEINYGGKRDPGDVVDGLTLVDGRTIGFNFILEFEDKTRAVLTPHHAMYATRLRKPPKAIARIQLRGAVQTRESAPVVEVVGSQNNWYVDVVSGERTLGRRLGDGPITLVGLDADGAYPLVARAMSFGGNIVTSAELCLTIDRSAAAPRLSLTGSTLAAECEPGATLEVWCGQGFPHLPVAPIASAITDRTGRAAVELPKELRGWCVTAFDGSDFARQVYHDLWPTIDRDFKDSAPDKRLSADRFSFTFDAMLMIETAGPYSFELSSDDGARLYVDNELVVNNWGQHGMTPRIGAIDLNPLLHRIHIDYYELDGWAGIRLRYMPGAPDVPTASAWTTAIPVFPPVMTDTPSYFARQIDSLGNESPFAAPVIPSK